MMHLQYDIVRPVLILFILLIFVSAEPQDTGNSQRQAAHLPETKFSFSEYSEYPDNEDADKGLLASQWDQTALLNHNIHLENGNLDTATSPVTPIQSSDAFDKNIVWDSQWGSNLKLGQVSGVSIDLEGNVAIFHRGDRIWGHGTFDNENRFDRDNGPITQDTIILLDKAGHVISQWGKNMFYLPHGLTVDCFGNYWITDVAMHQVFKFDYEDIKKYREKQKFKSASFNPYDTTKLLQDSILKPSLTLGEPFQPGNDNKRFCKPTDVAVQENGDFFVSDGYCNSRIIKFNKKGERISEWGRHWGITKPVYQQPPPPNAFFVPHALSLASELNYIFVSDRENGRILSFSANNGTFYKEYKSPVIGTKIYSAAYARGKLYLINGPDPYLTKIRVHGIVLDVNSGKILSQFGPGKDMDMPHDIAVSEDGSNIYVVELNAHKVYRFFQGVNASKVTPVQPIFHHKFGPITDVNSKEIPNEGNATATLVLSLVTAAVIFIALCVAIAAIVARCQKRGCLLTMRKRMRWEAERRENFKLSSLLETRRGKGYKFLKKRPNTRDFSKLNTEPETSEDEHPENSLTRII